jgi:predicted RNase H-like nuclease (RuvC/YqgF family)
MTGLQKARAYNIRFIDALSKSWYGVSYSEANEQYKKQKREAQNRERETRKLKREAKNLERETRKLKREIRKIERETQKLEREKNKVIRSYVLHLFKNEGQSPEQISADLKLELSLVLDITKKTIK